MTWLTGLVDMTVVKGLIFNKAPSISEMKKKIYSDMTWSTALADMTVVKRPMLNKA